MAVLLAHKQPWTPWRPEEYEALKISLLEVVRRLVEGEHCIDEVCYDAVHSVQDASFELIANTEDAYSVIRCLLKWREGEPHRVTCGAEDLGDRCRVNVYHELPLIPESEREGTINEDYQLRQARELARHAGGDMYIEPGLDGDGVNIVLELRKTE